MAKKPKDDDLFRPAPRKTASLDFYHGHMISLDPVPDAPTPPPRPKPDWSAKRSTR